MSRLCRSAASAFGRLALLTCVSAPIVSPQVSLQAQTPVQTPAHAAPAPLPPLTGSIASHPGWPAANPADVRSVDALLNALYSTLSGPAGQPRDWQRFRSLFLPDAQLIPIRPLPANHTDAVVLTPDLYVARASRTMASQGFFEQGVHTTTEQFGAMLHLWSTYESRHAPSDPRPFARGINSLQVLRDGDRFWIVNLVWNAEAPGNPIPSDYLGATQTTHAATPPELNAPFSGRWVGTLEHRDLRSHQPSSTPVWLTMTPSADGTAVTLAYTFDDGIRSTVNERSVLSFAPAYSMATVLSDSSKTAAAFRVDGLDTLRNTGRGILVLSGSETELSQHVDTRITITIGPKLFTWRKETRLPGPGHDFTLRDNYTLTRDGSSS